MVIKGKIEKSGSFWVAIFPILGPITQGKTQKELLEMVTDWFRCSCDNDELEVEIFLTRNGVIEVDVNDAELVPLLFHHLKINSDMSYGEIANKLGAKSRNAFAQYEKRKAVPSLEKLQAIFSVFSNNYRVVLEDRLLVT